MKISPPSSHAHQTSGSATTPNAVFADLYLRLLRPNGNGPERLRRLQTAACEANAPGGANALEQFLSETIGQPVH